MVPEPVSVADISMEEKIQYVREYVQRRFVELLREEFLNELVGERLDNAIRNAYDELVGLLRVSFDEISQITKKLQKATKAHKTAAFKYANRLVEAANYSGCAEGFHDVLYRQGAGDQLEVQRDGEEVRRLEEVVRELAAGLDYHLGGVECVMDDSSAYGLSEEEVSRLMMALLHDGDGALARHRKAYIHRELMDRFQRAAANTKRVKKARKLVEPVLEDKSHYDPAVWGLVAAYM